MISTIKTAIWSHLTDPMGMDAQDRMGLIAAFLCMISAGLSIGFFSIIPFAVFLAGFFGYFGLSIAACHVDEMLRDRRNASKVQKEEIPPVPYF